jgi:hypothetical protein
MTKLVSAKRRASSSSSAKPSGITKASSAKRTTPAIRRTDEAYVSGPSNYVYRLDFGSKHKRKNIQDIMTDGPSYLVELALTDRTGDLLKKRPGLVKGLRELSNEYLNTKPQLRRAMEAKEIYPSDQGTASFFQGQDDECRYMQATQWNSILEKNVGPEYELNDLYTTFEGFDDAAVVTFTGTIVRTEAILFDNFSDDLQETYAIRPADGSEMQRSRVTF